MTKQKTKIYGRNARNGQFVSAKSSRSPNSATAEIIPVPGQKSRVAYRDTRTGKFLSEEEAQQLIVKMRSRNRKALEILKDR